MGNNISEHFSKDEIKCHCGCGQAYVDIKLYAILEIFRDYVKHIVDREVPLITHCVNRCVEHNNKFIKKGASSKSLHLTGRAWDGHGEGISIKEIKRIAKKAYKEGILPGGLGLYPWGIHIDSGLKRLWKG